MVVTNESIPFFENEKAPLYDTQHAPIQQPDLQPELPLPVLNSAVEIIGEEGDFTSDDQTTEDVSLFLSCLIIAKVYPPSMEVEFQSQFFPLFSLFYDNDSKLPIFPSYSLIATDDDTTDTNLFNNATALYESNLTFFLDSLKAQFDLNDDLNVLFPQLNLSLSDSSTHCQDLSLHRLYDLFCANEPSKSYTEPFRIIITKTNSNFKKQLDHLISVFENLQNDLNEEDDHTFILESPSDHLQNNDVTNPPSLNDTENYENIPPTSINSTLLDPSILIEKKQEQEEYFEEEFEYENPDSITSSLPLANVIEGDAAIEDVFFEESNDVELNGDGFVDVEELNEDGLKVEELNGGVLIEEEFDGEYYEEEYPEEGKFDDADTENDVEFLDENGVFVEEEGRAISDLMSIQPSTIEEVATDLISVQRSDLEEGAPELMTIQLEIIEDGEGESIPMQPSEEDFADSMSFQPVADNSSTDLMSLQPSASDEVGAEVIDDYPYDSLVGENEPLIEFEEGGDKGELPVDSMETSLIDDSMNAEFGTENGDVLHQFDEYTNLMVENSSGFDFDFFDEEETGEDLSNNDGGELKTSKTIISNAAEIIGTPNSLVFEQQEELIDFDLDDSVVDFQTDTNELKRKLCNESLLNDEYPSKFVRI